MNVFQSFYSKINKNYLFLILLWAALTTININKAYHIDDTFHLEAGNCIQEHPLRPMSGMINWGNFSTPMHNHNQPPLFFYAIALTDYLFGDSEIVMHLLLSLFTFLALYYFYKLLLFFKVKKKKTLLTIFAFCPAFIVNQNLMTDVPIVALTLGFAYYLLKGQRNGTYKDYIISACLLAAGLMIKYSLLPLFVILIYSTLISKNYKKMFVILIPIAVLAIWGIWNIWEFDYMHIMKRHREPLKMQKIFPFLATLTAVAPFIVTYFYMVFPRKITAGLIFSGLLAFVLSAFFVYHGVIGEAEYEQMINEVFQWEGMALLIIFTIYIIRLFLKEKFALFTSEDFIILLFVGGFSFFIFRFAPFNATRHILLIIPFILLFTHRLFDKAGKLISVTAVILTIITGTLLGISDWRQAGFYRKAAEKVNVRPGNNNTVWFAGHWGWQWYARKQGMKMYSVHDEFKVRNGDYLVFPKEVDVPMIRGDLVYEPVDYITEDPDFWTFFSGKHFASLYNSFINKPAWTLSRRPIDTVVVNIVTKEIGVADVVKRIESDKHRYDVAKKRADAEGIELDSLLLSEAEAIVNKKRK